MMSRIGRYVLLFVGTLVGLAAALLAALNVFLNSGWLPAEISKRPERLRLEYASAWSLWPGRVHVRGLRLDGEDARARWSVTLDSAELDVRLPELAQRSFWASAVRGQGAMLALELKPPPPEGAAAPSASRPPGRGPWHLRLDEVRLEDVRELRLDEYRFRGRARIEGGLELLPRRALEIRPTRIEAEPGEVLLGAHRVAGRVAGRIEGRLGPVRLDRHRGREILPFLSAQGDIEADVESLRFLKLYLRRADWLSLDGGGGRIKARLVVEQGRLAPGSRLQVDSTSIELAIPDYLVSGTGAVRWEVRADASQGPVASLSVDLLDYGMQRAGYPAPHIHGQGLHLDAESRDLELGSLFEDLAATMELPRASVPNLGFYNAYLPTDLGLVLESGRGFIESRFEASTQRQQATGQIVVAARDVRARYESFLIAGNWRLSSRLPGGDLEKKLFDVSGSSFSVDGVSVVDTANHKANNAEGWWATVQLQRAILRPGHSNLLAADLDIELRDAQPLIQLYSTKEKLPGWIERIFREKKLRATARLRVGADRIEIDDLVIKAKLIEILARLRLSSGGRKRGILYASYGPFSVGIDLRDDKTKLKLISPKKWYREHPPLD
jgi:hypothetical protein